MNPQDLKELLKELVQAITLVMQSDEQLPDEFQGLLAETLANLVSRIEQTTQGVERLPAQPPGPQPSDISAGMPSSNVEGFAYDDKNERLLVRFLGKYPERNGPIYAYQGVPQNIFDIFRRGAIPAKTDGKNKWGQWWKGKYPSLGAAMAHLIKAAGYPYQRVSG